MTSLRAPLSPRALLPLLLVIAVLAVPLAPATASPAPELVYLALGDSVPSGTDVPDGTGYPPRLGQRLADASGRPVRLLNRARGGERSAGVLAEQIADLRAVGPELVTLTVGANDFLIPAFECAAASLDRSDETRCRAEPLLRAVPTFEANYRAILRRLVDETDATVVATTYYNPFPRGSRCAPGLADLSLRFLNSAIADIAAERPDRTILVDLAPLFKGHEGREPAGWFAPSPTRLACTDIHPSSAGHDAIASAILDALAPRLALATP